MIKARAVLFDFDGVIADTEGNYSVFWSEMDRLYPTGVENFAQSIKGNILDKILSNNFPSAEVQADIRRRLAEYELNMPYELFGGVMQLLAELRSKGIATAIVTSSSPQKMERVFASNPELPVAVDLLVTDADVTKGKPDPQCYLIAAEKLNVPIGECVVVEDSVNGLLAGRASGAHVVGLATTNSAEVVAPHADVVLPDVAALACKIENIN